MSLTNLLASIAAKAASPAPPPPAPGTTDDAAAAAADPAATLLTDIRRASQLADSLSLYSDNDGLDDLPTSTLRPLLLHAVWAEVETRVRTKPGDVDERRARLLSSKSHYLTFIKTLFDLGILPPPPSSSSSTSSSSSSQSSSPLQLLSSLLRPYARSASSSSSSSSSPASMPTNPHQRRELKVALFKMDRAFKAALDEYRHAAREKAGVRAGSRLNVPGTGSTTAATTGSEETTAAAAGMLQEPEEAQWDWMILPRRSKQQQQRGGSGSGSDDDDDDDEEASDAFVLNSASASASTSSSSSTATIETPHSLRAYLLLLLRYHALLASNNLGFIEDELSLLANVPASAQRDAAERQAREEAEAQRRRGGGGSGNDDFRLETRFDAGAPGPLMDDKGRPLRPFTITSGRGGGGTGGGGPTQPHAPLPTHDLNERTRLRSQVFQRSERLPTMSIDEYLAEEQRRGNVLTGGGPEGAAKATPKEERALRAEMDGTRDQREALEEMREEERGWDEWREEHRRGEGNTMNRG